jgi:hypothetical protein
MANSSPLLLLFFHRASPQVPEGTLNYMATGFFTIPPNSLFTTSSLDPKRKKQTGIFQTLKTSEKRQSQKRQREEDDIFVRSGSHVPSSRKYPRSRNF